LNQTSNIQNKKKDSTMEKTQKEIKLLTIKNTTKMAMIPGSYTQKNWVKVCRPLSKTLTLFKTNICNFSK